MGYPRDLDDYSEAELLGALAKLQASKPFEPKLIRVVINDHIRATLAHCDGNKTKAARLLGIDRRSLYRWLSGDNRPSKVPSRGALDVCPSP